MRGFRGYQHDKTIQTRVNVPVSASAFSILTLPVLIIITFAFALIVPFH